VTPAETARLLTLIAAYDRRTLGESDVLAWHPLVERYSFDECADAVRAHFASSTSYLMPVHVLDRVRATRRDAIERQQSERLAIEYRQAQAVDVGRYVAQVAAALDARRPPEQRRAVADREARKRARSVACPYCGAREGQPCVVPDDGRELTKTLAHSSRLDAVAEREAAP
jgi:hypothetical protein